MKSHGPYLDLIRRSAVFWSLVFNLLRLASAVFLLPLLLHKLTTADLGMYFAFVTLSALVPVVDSAFSFNISRFVSYGMAGARRLQPQGIESSRHEGSPNYEMLWQLLWASRSLYRVLAAAVILILGTAGTAIVAMRVGETSSPTQTWIAWAVTVVAAAWEVYSGWWGAYLRGMNQVALSARISSLAYGVRAVLAGCLLAGGAGLLALPISGLLSGTLQRHLARRQCLLLLSNTPTTNDPADIRSLLPTIWPNSWRTGLKLSSLYVCTVVLAFLCLKFLGLEANARYGLSLQIVTVIHGMSGVWTAVKWPLVGQLRARQDLTAVRQVLWPRLWLQNLTFIALAVVAVGFGPQLLVLVGTDKRLIPAGWFLLMATNSFMEMQFATWSTVISTENRLPSLWPTVISSAVTILLVWLLIDRGVAGYGPLVLGPLIVGCLFNYWYWGYKGARELGTTWAGFVFTRRDLPRRG